MLSNQVSATGLAGFRAAFDELAAAGELTSFDYSAPRASSAPADAIRRELLEVAETTRPDVLLVVSPNSHDHDPAFVERFLAACGSPVVIHCEADCWDGRAKRINAVMRAWLAAADVVFSVAGEPQTGLLADAGARDVRYIPHTYCQVYFSPSPEAAFQPEVDVVMIGGGYARWGRVSRLPGAVDRARLVRSLQASELELAVYGSGWRGRGVRGPLDYEDQGAAIRAGAISINWDHFPHYVAYASDRLPISMAAGRPHATTAHPGHEWLPGAETGLFCEPSVDAVFERARELARRPPDELGELGARASRWVSGRLSHREAARFLLGAVEPRLLGGLPDVPWRSLADEWPAGIG